MRIRTLALCLAISTATAFAQHDSAAWYHPLHVGNEWIYKTTSSQTNFPNPPVSTVGIIHRTVKQDTVIENAVWSIMHSTNVKSGESEINRERYDTLTTLFSVGNDIIDSTACVLPYVPFGSPMSMMVQSVYPDIIVSVPTVSRHIKMLVTGAQREWIFSHGFGMTAEIVGDGDIFFGSGGRSYLAYAKINGIEYGTKNILMADSLSQYHPLQIGNKWIYKVTSYNFPAEPSISYNVREVAGDTIIGNMQYKKIINGNGIMASVERFDDITGNYVHHTVAGSIVEDSAAAHVVNTSFGINGSRKLNSVYADSVFGTSRLHREIVAANSLAESEMGWIYAYELGCVKHYIKELDPSPYGILDEDLVYAKINGVEYGTEPLGVDNETHSIPINYALYRNYPNPFNPVTIIEFTLPVPTSREIVILQIFDMLGRDIRTLVNEPLPPGRHIVRFDATGLATGLYFYQIQSGRFIDTKKMMYLK